MPRTLKDDHAGMAWDYVLTYPGVDEYAQLRFDPRFLSLEGAWGKGTKLRAIDLTQVEPLQVEAMVEHLRSAETSARGLRKLLEAHLSGETRSCAFCGGPLVGRADRRYCSSRCRVRAHRQRGDR